MSSSSDFQVFFKKLSANAILPTKGSAGAAGFDLYAAEDAIVPAARVVVVSPQKKLENLGNLIKGLFGLTYSKTEERKTESGKLITDSVGESEDCVQLGSALVKTDLACKIPNSHYGRIAPRSGLAWKNKITVDAGVVDADYRSNVGIILVNQSCNDFTIKKGDRIAQLIFEKCETAAQIIEVDDLESTERGAGGFGSTGV